MANVRTVTTTDTAAFRRAKGFALHGLRFEGWQYEHMSPALRAAFANHTFSLKHADGDRGCDFKPVVMRAVQHCGTELYYASERMRSDRDVVAAAVQNDPSAIGYAGIALFHNADFLWWAITVPNHHVLCYMTHDGPLWGDIEFLRAALETMAPSALANSHFRVPAQVRFDKQIILTMVRRSENDMHVENLVFSAPGRVFEDDQDVMLACVRRRYSAFRRASNGLKSSLSFVRQVVSIDGRALRYAATHLRDVKEVVMLAVANQGSAICFASRSMLDDVDVVRATLASEGIMLSEVNEAFRHDKELVLSAVKQNGHALRFAAPLLAHDPDVAVAAVTQSGLAFMYLPLALCLSKPVALAAVRNNGLAIELVPADLQSDPEIAIAAIKNHASAFGRFAVGLRLGAWALVAHARHQTPEMALEILVALENKIKDEQALNLPDAGGLERAVELAMELLPVFPDGPGEKALHRHIHASVERIAALYYGPTGIGGTRDRREFEREFAQGVD